MYVLKDFVDELNNKIIIQNCLIYILKAFFNREFIFSLKYIPFGPYPALKALITFDTVLTISFKRNGHFLITTNLSFQFNFKRF